MLHYWSRVTELTISFVNRIFFYLTNVHTVTRCCQDIKIINRSVKIIIIIVGNSFKLRAILAQWAECGSDDAKVGIRLAVTGSNPEPTH